jgi:hypothetical protein
MVNSSKEDKTQLAKLIIISLIILFQRYMGNRLKDYFLKNKEIKKDKCCYRISIWEIGD